MVVGSSFPAVALSMCVSASRARSQKYTACAARKSVARILARLGIWRLGFGIWDLGCGICVLWYRYGLMTKSVRRRRDRIRRIGPVHSRQVMQRDTCAPAVGGRPDKQRQQHNHHRQARHRMRTDHSEIDQDDNRANGQPIADDGEGPCITGITCEDQTADRTTFKLRPPGKQWSFATVRTALAQPAPKRRADQFRAGRRHPRDGTGTGL